MSSLIPEFPEKLRQLTHSLLFGLFLLLVGCFHTVSFRSVDIYSRVICFRVEKLRSITKSYLHLSVVLRPQEALRSNSLTFYSTNAALTFSNISQKQITTADCLGEWAVN